MRDELIKRIAREIAAHRKSGEGRVVFKVNSLVDSRVIRALYHASRAGVKVDLSVRGICCLRPGVKGVSENITVTSIVGRMLEHSRIYYFNNGGDEEVFIGSADVMPRNFDNRVEVLFPVIDSRLRRKVVDEILEVHLRDNVKARQLDASGVYSPRRPKRGEVRLNSQQWMLDMRAKRSQPTSPARRGSAKGGKGGHA